MYNESSMSATLKEQVKQLPQVPGVYLYKNNLNEIIYVGKAKNLKSRVSSYFFQPLDPNSKTAILVSNIALLEYIEAFSEFEALILEAELIKKYKPKYNILLKDDKSYLYIVIRKEKGIDFPKILTVRKPDILKTDTAFGPYPDGTSAKYIVRTLRKIFTFRDCSSAKFYKYKKLNKPCLYGHINLCSAPCVKNEAAHLKDYLKQINSIKKLLQGKSTAVIKDLKKQMNLASKNQEFEKAVKFREILSKFDYIRRQFTSPQEYMLNPYLVDDVIDKSLEELKSAIPTLTAVPKRIECYDISNISGTDAVGSMVVATDGRIDKSQYRKFKIKLKKSPDDFEMLREVIRRRLSNKWQLPDLFVIDGGKGQVSAVLEVFDEKNITIPVIGLAKRFETIILHTDGGFEEIVLKKDNVGLNLLQRLRDEAHRFAQKYHHVLRLKRIR